MTIPQTQEEQEARLSVIRRQLIELQPIRQELLTELRACEGRIEALCNEKYAIERTKIKIKICRCGESGLKTRATDKPLDMAKAMTGLDAAQSAALLAQLLRMQKEMAKDEVEVEPPKTLDEDEESIPIEPYSEDDEEEEDEEDVTDLVRANG